MRELYDEIGLGYARYRQPDPAIEAAVVAALGDARSVVSVGSGAGSYEPRHRRVVAVEPSVVMISQRPSGAAPVVRAVAEALPFRPRSFDAALAVLTVHHWPDLDAGLAELRRVAERQVILTIDGELHRSHWLRDYIPEIDRIFRAVPPVDAVAEGVGARVIEAIPLAHDTPDGMTVAYWRRPALYLDAARRAGGSAFQQVDPLALQRGLGRLEEDVASGVWAQRYAHLLGLASLDVGLRLVFN